MKRYLENPDLLAEIVRPAKWLVEIALVLVLGILIARLGWTLVAGEASVARLEPRAMPTLVGGNTPDLIADRTLLVRQNPFAAGETAAEVVPDVPETQLNLRLFGVITSEGSFGGSAQITTPDSQMSRYTVGEEVLSGVTLERVLADRVILRRNGVSETLILEGRGDGLSVIGNVQKSPATNPENVGLPPVPEQHSSEGEARSAIALISAVRAGPVQEDGRLVGYTLTPNGSADIMQRAGLLPGDVLVEVNGTSASELGADELVAELGTASAAILKIKRGEQARIVRVSFDE